MSQYTEMQAHIAAGAMHLAEYYNTLDEDKTVQPEIYNAWFASMSKQYGFHRARNMAHAAKMIASATLDCALKIGEGTQLHYDPLRSYIVR